MSRPDKHNYYLDIAQTVAKRSTCLRRHFGSIIVKNDVIIATGYNGAPRGRINCNEHGACLRDELKIPRGERYEICRGVHAEANAIVAASREQMLGAIMYSVCVDPATGEPVPGTSSCPMCRRLIINAGIATVIQRETAQKFTGYDVTTWVEDEFGNAYSAYEKEIQR
ncbi:MAG: dCMP deaminase family protein [Oscillospiraceae bacterium]|nr:dCMP deaminase family protein [Oscillospiraceae bacterium]